MKNRYRVIISNKNLYREVELTPDIEYYGVARPLYTVK